MAALYDALGVGLTGERISVKLSTGEPSASNSLDPDLIAGLVHQVNGTIVENNTAYGGQRSSTAMAQRSAADSMSLQLCSRSQSDTKWHTAP